MQFHVTADDVEQDQSDDNHLPEMEIAMKLSILEARIKELHKVRLQITSLIERKNHCDFNLQSKKESNRPQLWR